MDIFFPMAGQGARFGHKFKPFLMFGNDTFIEAAVRPFRPFAPQISRFVFVYLETQERDFHVSTRLAEMFRGLPTEVVLLETPTRGPAETIGLAVRKLQASGSAFVCDCDHELDVRQLFELISSGTPHDVLLPLWPLEGENLASWSVAKLVEGRVNAIAEKRMPEGPGQAMGVIGCYGFRDIADIARRAEAIGAINFSDVIARMTNEQKQVRGVVLDNATFFGDPQRLEHATTQNSTRGTV